MAPRARGRGKADGPGDGSGTVSALAIVPEKKIARGRNPLSHRPQGIIASICKRLVGGKGTFMDLARFAPEIEPGCAPVIEEWKRLSASKQTINLDLICKVKGIDPFHFLAVVAEAAIKYRDNASVIIAAMSMPQVVERSVKTALTKDGVKDREMLFRHAHFVPVPSGATFVNTFAAKVQNANGGESPALPSFENTIEAVDVEV